MVMRPFGKALSCRWRSATPWLDDDFDRTRFAAGAVTVHLCILGPMTVQGVSRAIHGMQTSCCGDRGALYSLYYGRFIKTYRCPSGLEHLPRSPHFALSPPAMIIFPTFTDRQGEKVFRAPSSTWGYLPQINEWGGIDLEWFTERVGGKDHIPIFRAFPICKCFCFVS